jgi:hypothetical protein
MAETLASDKSLVVSDGEAMGAVVRSGWFWPFTDVSSLKCLLHERGGNASDAHLGYGSALFEFFESHQSVFEGIDHCLRTVFQVQFAEQMAHVRLDCFFRNAESRGDLLVRSAEGHLP